MSTCAGTYDWAGALNLDPDPFEAWGFQAANMRRLLGMFDRDAASATPHVKWDALFPHTRSLLQAGSSSLPVQGRVSVREARNAGVDPTTGTAPPPGSQAVIDDEIMAFNPIPSDPSNPAGYTWLEEHPTTPPPPNPNCHKRFKRPLRGSSKLSATQTTRGR